MNTPICDICGSNAHVIHRAINTNQVKVWLVCRNRNCTNKDKPYPMGVMESIMWVA